MTSEILFAERSAFLLIVLITFLDVAGSQSIDTTRFATKNSYQSSFSSSDRDAGSSNLQVINKYCKPLQVSSVLRHGTRNPTTGEGITRINTVVQKFQATGDQKAVVQQLADVAAKFPLTTQGQLVPAGVLEHQGLGYRVVERYPSLLKQVTPEELIFEATYVTRTMESCQAFQQGFFNQHGRDLQANITKDDGILRFYDTCDAYQKLLANSSSQYQCTTFQNLNFPKIAKNYTRNLGLPTVNLTIDEIYSIHQIAAIEYAAYNTTYWAQYFNPEDLILLEYSIDLEKYYKLGYGYSISYEMSCSLFSTLFKDMDKVFYGQEYKKGLFYFAHAETVAPLFDVLGLYKDPQPLTYDNINPNRLYRTSYISPFCINVEFVQYDCDVQSIKNNSSSIPAGIFPADPVRNMTLMLVKEIPTKFPPCEALLCPYATVRQTYSATIDKCNYKGVCDVPPTDVPPKSSAEKFFKVNFLHSFLIISIVCIL